MSVAEELLEFARDEPFFLFVKTDLSVTSCYESDKLRFNRMYWSDDLHYVGLYTKKSNPRLMALDISGARGYVKHPAWQKKIH